MTTTPGEQRGMTLLEIDQTIAQLMCLREESDDAEEREVIDCQIKQWVATEVAKVSKCHAYIRRQEQEAEMAKEWAKQAIMWQHRHETRAQRVRDVVLSVMQERELSRLEGPTGSFTVRAPGGIRALDILDEAAIPDVYRVAVVKMNKMVWQTIQVLLEDEGPLLRELLAKVKIEVDNSAVRAALEEGLEVPGAKLREKGKSLMMR